MKLKVILNTLLSATTIIAVPFTEFRHKERAAGQPVNIYAADTDSLRSRAVNIQYYDNWTGVILNGSNLQSVTGTVAVPGLTVPTGGNDGTLYVGSAWVGIDGGNCSNVLIRTGISFWLLGGVAGYTAWSQWFPNPPSSFNAFRMKPADLIVMKVTANSTSGGTTTLENLSTSQIVSQSFSGELSELCDRYADWIVEDFQNAGSLLPLVDFNLLTFQNVSATNTSGATLGWEDVTILDIMNNGMMGSTCSLSESSSSVDCSFPS